MVDRGPYAKGRKRREAILQSTLEAFSELGSRGASMTAIARKVGISPALLQYYFATREDLLQAVITEWDRENAVRGQGLTHFAHFVRAIEHNVQIPGIIHLYMTCVVEATDPDHPHREFYAQRYHKLSPGIVGEVQRQQTAGILRPDLDPERIARIILATIEGLQIRWLHEPHFDLVDEFLYMLEMLGISTPELQTGGLASTDEPAASENDVPPLRRGA